jgi:hypothetical protein
MGLTVRVARFMVTGVWSAGPCYACVALANNLALLTRKP